MSEQQTRPQIEEAVETNKRRFRLLGYGTGDYINKCCLCHKMFIGDKRAIMCLPCAADKSEDVRSTLKAERDELVKALEPFAEAAGGFDAPGGKKGVPDRFNILKTLTVGNLRTARTTLAHIKANEHEATPNE